MASPNDLPIPSCHVVAMPYPGRGHINCMLPLCEAIAAKTRDILITVVVTEEWLGLVDKPAAAAAGFRFASIPNVVPSEHLRGDDLRGFITAVMTKMEEPFERLLDELPPPAVIITDACLPWAAEVADRRNIPVAYLWTMSASVYSLFYHLELLVQNGHFPISSSDAIVNYVPGLPPIHLIDLPTIMKSQESVTHFQSIFPRQSKTNYLILSSISALESQVVNSLKQTSQLSIFNICPNLIASHNSNHHDDAGGDNDDDDDDDDDLIIKWLDLCPPCSVLYISFGSFLLVPTTQMDEIAYGLCSSGIPFVWVVRRETDRLRSMCGENKGMVVPWCDQRKVLSHPSVGGFWSHCGWNSTKEAVMAGVPVLASPLFMDQVPNAKAIVEDWRVGWRVGKGVFGEEGLVGRDEICDLVRRFMGLEGSDRDEIAENARKLKSICEVDEFANADLEGFVESIKNNVQR